MDNLIGLGLKLLRESRDMKQLALASGCGVSQSLVSVWETTGNVDPKYWSTLQQFFEVELVDLREAAIASLAGQQVQNEETLDLWEDAVALSDRHTASARIALLSLSLRFLDHEHWMLSLTEGSVASALGHSSSEIWEEVRDSPFILKLGMGDFVKLRFPED